ncbi:MAG: hypothetical protein BM556_13565 [Bacteriovorax sp. MedPE-SWde]|nr:MAG: hypothetical protein BM556_13565 [Bacteriovorax sp. MedPE-SWde]
MKFRPILLSVIFLTSYSFADMSQNMSGQLTESPYEKDSEVEEGKESPFVSGNVQNDEATKFKKNSGVIFPPGQASSDWTNNVKGDSPFTYKGDQNYLEFKNNTIVKDLYKVSDTSWGFSYFYDTYDYKDRNSIYTRTFESDSADSVQAGYLMMNYRYNMYRGPLDLFFQLNAGLSYSTGKGIFSDDGSQSKANFNLWLLPLEFTFGTKVHVGRYVGLSVSGGPAVAGLIQNRSDRDEDEDGKNLRQVGYGYSAEGSLDFSLSQIFPSYGIYLKNNSEVSDMTFSIIAKTMSLSNFNNEDIEITGTSIGLGFKFEVL